MNELVKPSLSVDLDIDIPKIEPIKHNLGIIEDYAVQLKEFYSKLVFNDTQYKEAKDERAKVNSLMKKLKENRIETVKLFKEPIQDFEDTSKRIEKLLEESAGIIDSSVKKFDLEQQEIKRKAIEEKIETIREQFMQSYVEYAKYLHELEIIYDNRWFNKTFKDKDLEADIVNQFNAKVDDLDAFKRDAQTIVDFFNAADTEHKLNKEVYIERFKHCRDVNTIINDIKTDLELKKEVTIVVPSGTAVYAKEESELVDPFAGLSVNTPKEDKKLQKIEFMGTDEQCKMMIDYALSIGIGNIRKVIEGEN